MENLGFLKSLYISTNAITSFKGFTLTNWLIWAIVIFLRFLHYRGLTEHWQIEFEHPSQPSGQLLSQGQSKFSFGWHAQYLNVLTLKHSCTDNCYLLSTQTISSLKQADKHSESVGSQDEMHLSVSSTQISRQAVFRS